MDIINLGIGDPDLPTPAPIVERMRQEVGNPKHHQYPSYEGMLTFRQAVADWYQRRFGVSLDAGTEVLTLIGSKEGIGHVPLALVNPGDVVLVPTPGYPVYPVGTGFAGGVSYMMPLTKANHYLPDLTAIPADVARKAKLMFLNYPNNPTSATAGKEFFKRVVDFAQEHRIIVCHDAAYSEIYYDGRRPASFLEADGAKEVGVEFHSLSKTFNMTGWRIGFAIGNPTAVKALAQIKSNIDTDVFRAIQAAGVTAFTGPMDHIEECNKLYIERRDLAVAELQKLGWHIKPNKATFYMWLPVPKGMTSAEFSTKMLDNAGIVVPPGTAYGPGGEGWFRLSLCTGKERLKEAFDRMAKHSMTFEPAKASV